VLSFSASASVFADEDYAISTTPPKQARIPISSILRNISLLIKYPKSVVQNACVFCTICIVAKGSKVKANTLAT
jgi:hypothetical protein